MAIPCAPARVVHVTRLSPHMIRITLETVGDWRWHVNGIGDERVDIAIPRPGETRHRFCRLDHHGVVANRWGAPVLALALVTGGSLASSVTASADPTLPPADAAPTALPPPPPVLEPEMLDELREIAGDEAMTIVNLFLEDAPRHLHRQ